MANGDIRWFAQGLLDLGNKIHDLDSDDLRVGFITSAATPALGDAAPHWGGTGTTNFNTSEVTGTGGNYPAEGYVLVSVSWSLVSNVPTLRATDISIAQHASNPTDARWGIVYNNTDANKRAIGFLDFGSVRDLTSGAFTFNFGGSGTDLLTLTQS